jgi:hypothetical protein
MNGLSRFRDNRPPRAASSLLSDQLGLIDGHFVWSMIFSENRFPLFRIML